MVKKQSVNGVAKVAARTRPVTASSKNAVGFNISRKTVLVVTLIVIVILSSITIWDFKDLKKNLESYSAKPLNVASVGINYEELSKQLAPDPEASKQLIKSVLTEKDIKREVENTFEVSQYIPKPVISDSKLKITNETGDAAITSYFERTVKGFKDFENRVLSSAGSYFSPETNSYEINKDIADTQELIDSLYEMPVPKEAVAYHKAEITVFNSFNDLAVAAAQYSSNVDFPYEPQMYKSYTLINNALIEMDQSFEILDQKYSIASKTVVIDTMEDINIPFVKTAHGFAVIVVGNTWQAVKDAIKVAIAKAFTTAINSIFDKLMALIDRSFTIANQLFYVDALVRVKYTDSYLQKYVRDPFDRAMVQKFIPQFNCNKQQDFREIFQARAKQYLNYDPSKIDFTKPGFEEQMIPFGTRFATPEGLQTVYEGMAQQTLGQAYEAATREVLSQGLKAVQDQLGKSIKSASEKIKNAQLAILINKLNLGTSNPESVISQIVAGLTTTFFNRFLFSGAVIAEQGVCASLPTTNAMLPQATETNFDSGSIPPDTTDQLTD